MGIIPTKRIDMVVFAAQHRSAWTNAPTAIGLTAAEVTSLNTALNALNAAMDAENTAKTNAKTTAATARAADRDTRKVLGDLIKKIKGFAATSANPLTVYNTALLPEPKTASPLPPPGQPTDFKFELETTGELTVRFKCTNPVGSGSVVYNVTRLTTLATGNQTTTDLGAFGARKFVDDSIPAGTASVTYTVTAQRGSVFGPASTPQVVQFGTGTGGAATLKMAA